MTMEERLKEGNRVKIVWPQALEGNDKEAEREEFARRTRYAELYLPQISHLGEEEWTRQAAGILFNAFWRDRRIHLEALGGCPNSGETARRDESVHWGVENFFIGLFISNEINERLIFVDVPPEIDPQRQVALRFDVNRTERTIGFRLHPGNLPGVCSTVAETIATNIAENVRLEVQVGFAKGVAAAELGGETEGLLTRVGKSLGNEYGRRSVAWALGEIPLRQNQRLFGDLKRMTEKSFHDNGWAHILGRCESGRDTLVRSFLGGEDCYCVQIDDIYAIPRREREKLRTTHYQKVLIWVHSLQDLEHRGNTRMVKDLLDQIEEAARGLKGMGKEPRIILETELAKKPSLSEALSDFVAAKCPREDWVYVSPFWPNDEVRGVLRRAGKPVFHRAVEDWILEQSSVSGSEADIFLVTILAYVALGKADLWKGEVDEKKLVRFSEQVSREARERFGSALCFLLENTVDLPLGAPLFQAYQAERSRVRQARLTNS